MIRQLISFIADFTEMEIKTQRAFYTKNAKCQSGKRFYQCKTMKIKK
jgi:hypothetical protein